MGMYAIGLMPMLTMLLQNVKDVIQVAFADDLTGIGQIDALKNWWDKLLDIGKYVGYHVNESKSCLIVKSQHLEYASQVFSGSNIIITEGHRHLGAVIGNETSKEIYVSEKVSEWIAQLEQLIKIAKTQPHSAFSAFNHGLRHRYTYIMRTIPNISALLKPLDKKIDEFIKVLLNDHNFNHDDRLLYSLPAKKGGLGIIIPSNMSDQEYFNSREITRTSTNCVVTQEKAYTDNRKEIKNLKAKIKKEKQKRHSALFEELKLKIVCKDKLRALLASIENGASNWLNVLPLKEHGFFLAKQTFWDAVCLRYSIPLQRMPLSCVCGAPFNVQHALSCPKGGYIIGRHNEIRDFTVEILKEICSDVRSEPPLQPLNGEILSYASAITTNEARSDVSARGFWIRGQTAFSDIRVFNPLANCYRNQTLEASHRRNENEKKRAYNERIIHVEHGSFTPLVFSCFGGMSRECSTFYSHAAELLAEKRNIPRSTASCWLKTRLNFSLLRSCLLCIRRSRSSRPDAFIAVNESDIGIVAKESNMKMP